MTTYLKTPDVICRLLTLAFVPIEQCSEKSAEKMTALVMHQLQGEAISVIQECGYGAVVLESLLLHLLAKHPF